mmetsp:Transcript_29565/g.58148  ORF Transcript_29565/g.58148 Transcript_29565/m.58148 type:complete len:238 (-) Transcript_29565:725-1438(-)
MTSRMRLPVVPARRLARSAPWSQEPMTNQRRRNWIWSAMQWPAPQAVRKPPKASPPFSKNAPRSSAHDPRPGLSNGTPCLARNRASTGIDRQHGCITQLWGPGRGGARPGRGIAASGRQSGRPGHDRFGELRRGCRSALCGLVHRRDCGAGECTTITKRVETHHQPRDAPYCAAHARRVHRRNRACQMARSPPHLWPLGRAVAGLCRTLRSLPRSGRGGLALYHRHNGRSQRCHVNS